MVRVLARAHEEPVPAHRRIRVRIVEGRSFDIHAEDLHEAGDGPCERDGGRVGQGRVVPEPVERDDAERRRLGRRSPRPVRERGRVARDRTAQHVEQERQVVGVSGERAVGGEVEPVRDRITADHPVRRFEPREPAVARGDADRTAAVGGGRDRGEAGGERGGRAAAGAAGVPLAVPRVPRRAEQQVGRVAGRRELRRVRLAHHDGAGGAEAGDHRGVHRRRRRPRERHGAERGPHARHIGDVLHQERQPGERTRIVAVGDQTIEDPRIVECLRPERHHRAQVRIESLDTADRLRHELVRPHPAIPDRGSQPAERRHGPTPSAAAAALARHFGARRLYR